MPNNRFLNYAELAERMGRTVRWMRLNMKGLRQDNAFPGPIPGFGNRWDPAAIDAWLGAQREETSGNFRRFPDVFLPCDPPLTDDEFTARLDARAQMMGRDAR
jgi:hypothetical protein